MTSPLDGISKLRTARTKRISSYDRTGGNADRITIGPGETRTIARIDGAGIIRHIWITVNHPDAMYGRNMVLRMYWDGAGKPSVECPLGDFFGQGWGEHYNYAALPLSAAPDGGKALNSFFPMPFSQGAKIQIENQSEQECRAFYYYIDYEEHDSIDEDQGRFHAWWNRTFHEPPEGVENEWDVQYPQGKNLTDKFNHPIVNAQGPGHYVGVNYFVDCPTTLWYGEGDDMFFIDDEPWPPSLHGTGTEDYFNTSWCPKELYSHPYFGFPRVNNSFGWLGRTHCYRFHMEDPVIFQKSLRGSIERGHANSISMDLITVAYWYQQKPHTDLPALPPVEKRQNRIPISPVDIHRWREAWRQAQGGGALWGNEDNPAPLTEKIKCVAQENATRQVPANAQSIAEEELKKQQKMLEE